MTCCSAAPRAEQRACARSGAPRRKGRGRAVARRRRRHVERAERDSSADGRGALRPVREHAAVVLWNAADAADGRNADASHGTRRSWAGVLASLARARHGVYYKRWLWNAGPGRAAATVGIALRFAGCTFRTVSVTGGDSSRQHQPVLPPPIAATSRVTVLARPLALRRTPSYPPHV